MRPQQVRLIAVVACIIPLINNLPGFRFHYDLQPSAHSRRVIRSIAKHARGSHICICGISCKSVVRTNRPFSDVAFSAMLRTLARTGECFFMLHLPEYGLIYSFFTHDSSSARSITRPFSGAISVQDRARLWRPSIPSPTPPTWVK